MGWWGCALPAVPARLQLGGAEGGTTWGLRGRGATGAEGLAQSKCRPPFLPACLPAFGGEWRDPHVLAVTLRAGFPLPPPPSLLTPPTPPPPCSLLDNKLSEERIAAIVTEAVVIEKEFVCDALPVELIGMNARMMSQVGVEGQRLGASGSYGEGGASLGWQPRWLRRPFHPPRRAGHRVWLPPPSAADFMLRHAPHPPTLPCEEHIEFTAPGGTALSTPPPQP